MPAAAQITLARAAALKAAAPASSGNTQLTNSRATSSSAAPGWTSGSDGQPHIVSSLPPQSSPVHHTASASNLPAVATMSTPAVSRNPGSAPPPNLPPPGTAAPRTGAPSPPPAGANNQTFQDFINSVGGQLDQNGGVSSSSSSGGLQFRSAESGAAGGGTSSQVQASGPNDLMHVDPRYRDALDALNTEVAGQTGLAQLDATSQSELDASTDSQLARSHAEYQDNSDDLLTRLYAGGTNQSSMGADQGGRLLRDQGLVDSNIRGQAADRAISLRQDLTNNRTQNNALRAQILGGEQDSALKELGINVGQLEQGRDRQTDWDKANLASRTGIQEANIGAGASVASAQIGANASRFSALAGLYGDQQRINESSREYDSSHDLDERKFSSDNSFRDSRAAADDAFHTKDQALAQLNSDRNLKLGEEQVQATRYGISSENNRYNEGLDWSKQQYGSDSAFRQQQFDEGKREFDTTDSLNHDRLDLDWYNANTGRKQVNNTNSSNKTSAWTSALGSILGAFSDSRLKTNLHPADIDSLHGVTWNWQLTGKPGAGVVAQDVLRVMPDAVTVDASGFLQVDYAYVIAALVESNRDLRARVAKMECA